MDRVQNCVFSTDREENYSYEYTFFLEMVLSTEAFLVVMLERARQYPPCVWAVSTAWNSLPVLVCIRNVTESVFSCLLKNVSVCTALVLALVGSVARWL